MKLLSAREGTSEWVLIQTANLLPAGVVPFSASPSSGTREGKPIHPLHHFSACSPRSPNVLYSRRVLLTWPVPPLSPLPHPSSILSLVWSLQCHLYRPEYRGHIFISHPVSSYSALPGVHLLPATHPLSCTSLRLNKLCVLFCNHSGVFSVL